MTTTPDDDVLEQLGRGEVEALAELFAAYGPYLRAVVRRELADHLRAKFDSVDVVQSVWVQVIQILGRDGWRVTDQNHLRALLVTIARRRLVSRARRWGRGAAGDGPADDWAAVSDTRHAAPDAAAAAADLWAEMLRLTPPEHHPILTLRREGIPLAEIAARTGLHEGSVRRVLRRLARDLATRGGAAAPAGDGYLGVAE